MENKHCIITYDTNKTKIDKIKNVIKMLHSIVIIFKKIIQFIDSIQTMIIKFNDEIFNYYDNIPSVKEVLLQSIQVCYTNIQMLFNTSIESIYLVSFTSDDIPKAGISINYVNTIFSINSFRVIHSDDGIIKLVEYDSELKPISINWIGTHLNKINQVTFNDRLSKCFNNNLSTINSLKLKCMNFIQLINNLQKIIDI
jgi:hypothetical protein